MPSATIPTTVATGMRKPRIEGAPPILSGSTVMRSKAMMSTLPFGNRFLTIVTLYSTLRAVVPELHAPRSHELHRLEMRQLTTTYATTYGRGSTGMYGDLTTSYPHEKPADKGQTGPDGGPRKRGTARYESEGRRFESCRAHYKKPTFAGTLLSVKCR